jgi:hypothetical protein
MDVLSLFYRSMATPVRGPTRGSLSRLSVEAGDVCLHAGERRWIPIAVCSHGESSHIHSRFPLAVRHPRSEILRVVVRSARTCVSGVLGKVATDDHEFGII